MQTTLQKKYPVLSFFFIHWSKVSTSALLARSLSMARAIEWSFTMKQCTASLGHILAQFVGSIPQIRQHAGQARGATGRPMACALLTSPSQCRARMRAHDPHCQMMCSPVSAQTPLHRHHPGSQTHHLIFITRNTRARTHTAVRNRMVRQDRRAQVLPVQGGRASPTAPQTQGVWVPCASPSWLSQRRLLQLQINTPAKPLPPHGPHPGPSEAWQ